jgi:phosphate transport system substrate-binding protein
MVGMSTDKGKSKCLQRKNAAVKIAPAMKVKILLLLTAVFLIGCEKKADPNEPAGFLQVKGSDTIVNAAQKISEEFMKEYPHIFVAVTGGGSGVGIASLINKTADIATASREITKKEIELARKRGVEPNEFVIAFDGVAVIVNKNNPVDKLSINDLHRIFTGKAVSWKEFGGKDAYIVTLSREVSSGTYAYFKDEVVKLGKKESSEEFSSETLLLSSSQAIVEEVVTNEAAIGYLGMGYTSDRTKTIRISKDGEYIAPDVNSVLSKRYPLSRPLYFFTNGQPKGITKLYIEYALSPAGQKELEESGFVPRKQTIVKED